MSATPKDDGLTPGDADMPHSRPPSSNEDATVAMSAALGRFTPRALLGSRYRIIRFLGRGGMGEVYLAHDERLARDVAVKALLPGTLADDAARIRFRKEALALSKLNHPNIATVFDFDTQEGVDFLVMEYVAGEPLNEKLHAGSLAVKEVAELGEQLAEGLAAVHSMGLVHRDLKPGNVRLASDGRLKILDFGLAKLVRPTGDTTTESLADTRSLVGTLPYMAPEQLRGDLVDARTDLWAAGAVLYEMATQRRAFAMTPIAGLMHAILHETPRPPSAVNREISPDLDAIILKCLEKDPENRYQSAKELGTDLQRLNLTSDDSSKRKLVHQRRKRWVGMVIVASAAVLLAIPLAVNLGGWRERWPVGGRNIHSLAVLPLQNLSGDSTQAFFVDGMTKALINSLGKIAALHVSPSEAVLRYRNSTQPPGVIAHELNVDAIVKGFVGRSGDRVWIHAQMIQVDKERELWAGSYECNENEVMILQGGMAQTIANVIRVRLTPQEQSRLAGARPVDPAAYEAYLRGEQVRDYPYLKAIPYYRQALQIDSTFAPAMAALSLCYDWAPVWNEISPGEAARIALPMAARAVHLDENLAEAHAALGLGKFLLAWDWAGAEQELKRALELNPSSNEARDTYSFILICMMKRPAEAMELRMSCWQADPRSAKTAGSVGWGFSYLRRYDDAVEWLQRTRALDPTFTMRWLLAQTYACKGMYKEALAECDTLGWRGPGVGYTCAISGRRDKTIAILEEARRQEERGEYVNPWDIAAAYAGMGDKEQAFGWLRRALAVRDVNMVFLKVEPYWDNLRSDPRFGELMRQVGLSENKP
jgi:eukaryotic-like serine/threonine-protein kinase